MSQPPPAQAFDWLAAHTTMTLATAGSDGRPAAAAVFYAHDDQLNLYFLSEERTQHGRNLAALPLAAATIQSDGQDWRAIQGLQLRGPCGPVRPADLPRAALLYGRKYAFLTQPAADKSVGEVASQVLLGPLARARLYILRVEWLRLVDNTAGFGHKQEWQRDDSRAGPEDAGGFAA